MKHLRWFLVRHALAVDRQLWVGRADAQRPLSKEGIKQFKKLLKKNDFEFKNKQVVMVTSDFVRAIETARLIEKRVDVVEVCQTHLLRPQAPPQRFVTWLAAQDRLIEQSTILIIVGHEPHLSHLLGLVLTGVSQSFIQMKKGAIAELIFKPEKQHNSVAIQKALSGSFLLRSLVFPDHN